MSRIENLSRNIGWNIILLLDVLFPLLSGLFHIIGVANNLSDP